MKKKPLSLLLLLGITVIIFTMPITPVIAAVIWAGQAQLTFDPTMVEPVWEPYQKKYYNITVTVPVWDGLPSLAQVRNGSQLTVWCVWQSDETINDNLFYEVAQLGGNWDNDSKTQLTNETSENVAPAITQTADNKIWVVWSSNRTGSYNLFYKTSPDVGRTWSSEPQLTSYSKDDNTPAIMQAQDGKIWVAWSRNMNATNDDIFYKTFDGTVWSTEIQLTTYVGSLTEPGFDRQPALMQTKDGRIWVVWTRFVAGTDNWQILARTFNGVSWSNEITLANDPKIHDYEPTVFQAQNNTIYLFYTSRAMTTNAVATIYYKTSADNGTTWSASYQYTTDPTDDLWPSAIQSQDRMIWVAWTSTLTGNGKIYYRVSYLGDISGPAGVPDGSIDIYDLTAIARALGTSPTWPHGTSWGQWNPLCDLNADNKVTGLDLAIAGKNYGQHA